MMRGDAWLFNSRDASVCALDSLLWLFHEGDGSRNTRALECTAILALCSGVLLRVRLVLEWG